MSLVVDASVAACWLLEDERHPVAEAAYKRLIGETASVPTLWWFEMRNLLMVSERRNRITATDTRTSLRLLHGLPIAIDDDVVEDDLLDLARRHRLTAYDAAYVELALRRRLPLATLDRALMAAAQAENVALVGAVD